MTPDAPLLLWAAFLAFAVRRLLTYLHVYQQDEYSTRRFLPWMLRTHGYDRRVSLALIAAEVSAPRSLKLLLALAIFAAAALYESNPLRAAKKPLVLTSRATRILALALVLAALAAMPLTQLALAARLLPLWLWAIAVQALPFLLFLANLLLSPLEMAIQARYRRQAAARLRKVGPAVIGITGSFGKTSVKHLLGHILETHAPTAYARGSVNTPMGVSRFLREHLPEGTRFYIGEMGAYGVGSIARLCRLTPPHLGILTALGEAHYERFKTLDNVARAKLELAQAVLRKDGKMVIAEQVLEQPFAAAFVKRHRRHFIVCGTGPGCDVVLSRAAQTARGTSVSAKWKGKSHTLAAPLWGAHQAMNMALAFAMAVTVGVPAEQASAALKTAPQTRHRLEVKPQPGGGTLIDDAYNSNPAGFAAALETLSLFKGKGRRILVTPGIIELGPRHAERHAELGKLAARHVDVALVVRPEAIPTFVAALKPALGHNLHTFPGFKQARAWLARHAKPGDTILLENDLPDLLERRLSL
jgi:UDP-N-acetylmuramoyl-tripeptide--D-alanyl-D-alanine ligase